MLFFGCRSNCHSQQFRCETDIYQNSQTKPVAHSITIFNNHKIYDLSFDRPPGGKLQNSFTEAVIFDQAKKTITIINPKRKVFLKITNQELSQLVVGLKMNEVIKKNDPFILEPKLKEKVFSESKKLQLVSDRITYRCKGKKERNPKVLSSFYYYVHWSTNLIATRPGRILPFARTKLNKAIEKQAWLPTEVNIIDKPKNRQEYQAKAKHHYTFLLSEIDHKRLKSVEDIAAKCRKVNLKELRGLGQEPVKEAKK